MKKFFYGKLLLSCLLFGTAYAMTYSDAQIKTNEPKVASLLAQTEHLKEATLEKALIAFENAIDAGITDSKIYTIIDYSHNSNTPRLWVFDLASNKLLFEELVAHGRGTGELHATKFSNVPQSYQSSLGLFKTEDTYQGRNGYSLRLEGLEDNVNHLAKERAIVIHGANYVAESFIAKHGRLGRSHGCPAVNPSVNKQLINTIKGGSLVFIYYPDKTWLAKSEFLKDEGNTSFTQL